MSQSVEHRISRSTDRSYRSENLLGRLGHVLKQDRYADTPDLQVRLTFGLA